MNWNPDDFSDDGKLSQQYRESPGKIDYADPAYYQTTYPVQPSAPPVESYADYAHGPTVVNAQSPLTMEEYRGPKGMEGYTADAGAEQRDAAAQGKLQTGKARKGLAGLGGIGAVIAALLKLQWLIYVLKFGWAGLSVVVSIAVYSFVFGWQFAVGLVALLFVHEMGHALVMKLKGIPIGGLIFVPFLGAAVFMGRMPKNAQDEAEVGIAGPVAGALAAGVCLALAELPNAYPIWAPLAYFGFFMNLFNLVPVLPFDGGRVLAAIDRRAWIVGFIGLLGVQIWQWFTGNTSIWLLFIIVIAGTQLWARRSSPKTPESESYYAVSLSARIALSVLYFGLAAVLVLGMSLSHGLIFQVGQ